MIIHYFTRALPGFRPNVTVHVGAHRGEEAELHEAMGARRVVWIEGDDALAAEASAILGARPTSTTEHLVVHALVTDRDGVETGLHLFSNEGQSNSIFPGARKFFKLWPSVRETGEVKMVASSRLDTVLQGISVAPADVDVLVMDIQGAELLALKGAGAYLQTPALVEVEVSKKLLYEGGAHADEVDSLLTAAGFVRLNVIPGHGDALYARRNRFAPELLEALIRRGEELDRKWSRLPAESPAPSPEHRQA